MKIINFSPENCLSFQRNMKRIFLFHWICLFREKKNEWKIKLTTIFHSSNGFSVLSTIKNKKTARQTSMIWFHYGIAHINVSYVANFVAKEHINPYMVFHSRDFFFYLKMFGNLIKNESSWPIFLCWWTQSWKLVKS